jgi:TatD DNase family protein
MDIIDTHSHFNLRQFAGDRADAIGRMEAANIGTFCVGVDYESSELAVRIARDHASIWAIVGQHPTEWNIPFDTDKMKALAQERKVVAIGECGLDYFRKGDRFEKEKQHVLFDQQIALACELNLPLMLHIRPTEGTMNAYEDAIALFKVWKEKWPTMRGTVHFFAGTTDIARQFLELGFHISFSGIITLFAEYEEVVRAVPLDRVLPETDAPFAAPKPYRGQRNEPIYVVEMVKKIAELKGLKLDEVTVQLRKNVTELFGV